MTNQPTFINITERAYKYIRQFTIKNVSDALIELITNSYDAYNKTSFVEKIVDIDIINPDTIKIRDYAIGLYGEEMEKCFLQIGNFTASDNSRGFFSRGAKDVSALGDITFRSIKDNKFSSCILTSDAYGSMVNINIEATDEIRKKCNIPKNGMEVEIKLLPNFQNIDADNLCDKTSKLAVLRDIFSNVQNNYVFMREKNINNEILYEKRLIYTYPDGKQLLDIEYVVPGYETYTAKFTVYKVENPIDQPIQENEMEFGFLIKSKNCIYEINTIQDRFRWNPYINYLYGSLTCEGIYDLLMDYDINGASKNNPYPIIDPSRLTGLNTVHPFVMNLYSVPVVRIDTILKLLNTSISSNSITVDDIDNIIDILSNYGVNLFEENNVNLSFVPSYSDKLAEAIADQRSKYITYEKSYVMNDNYSIDQTQIDKYVADQLSKLDPMNTGKYMYVSDGNDLYQIPNIDDISNDPISIIDILPPSAKNMFNMNPYIYKLNSDRNVEKLYVFQKGHSSENTNTNTFTTTKKNLNIQFINDINIQQRYVIDYSNGINISINIHNPIVAKYITQPSDNKTNLNSIQSSESIVFLEQLLTCCLIDIIVESDITNKKIILDSNIYNNNKKIADYRNKIQSKIEVDLNNIFHSFIKTVKERKITKFNKKIDKTRNQLISKQTDMSDLDPLLDNLNDFINKYI